MTAETSPVRLPDDLQVVYQGVKDYAAGMELHQNPFLLDGERGSLWAEGWHNADRYARERLRCG